VSALVSVIVPALDEERELPATLDHLAALNGRLETIVSDGGSRDATLAIAESHPLGPRVVRSGGGRAAQLNEAARAASGEVLVFLHADSRLPPDAHALVVRAVERRGAIGGNFSLRFAGGDRFSRVLGAWYAAQRRAGIYYGDSTMWVRADVFRGLGGFRELPIMDDYDFARRLERSGSTACLSGPATTSARRWRALGIPRTILSWIVIRWLFVAGVPAERLAGLYRRAR
jgi:rSAM/selenodomain-associated transferase 2